MLEEGERFSLPLELGAESMSVFEVGVNASALLDELCGRA